MDDDLRREINQLRELIKFTTNLAMNAKAEARFLKIILAAFMGTIAADSNNPEATIDHLLAEAAPNISYAEVEQQDDPFVDDLLAFTADIRSKATFAMHSAVTRRNERCAQCG